MYAVDCGAVRRFEVTHLFRHRMMQCLRAWATLLALLCLAPDVHAHANLVDSHPRDGSVVEHSPAEIALRFDEPVTPIILKVLDAAGRDVAAGGALRSRDGEVRKAVPDLPAGGYVVTWRVVSADAHPIAGAHVFTIGPAAGGAVSTPVTGADDPWIIPVVVARILLYLSLLPAAGAMLFHGLVGAPLKIRPPASSGFAAAAAGAAVAAALLGLGFKGAQVLAASPPALLEVQTWRVAAATSTGLSLLVVAGGMAALLAFLTIGALRRAGAWPPTVAAVVALAGLSLTGHGASGPVWMPPLMALHAVIAAFWLGSLHSLLRLTVQGHPLRVEAVRRFSRIAAPLVSVLLFSGVVVALARLDVPRGLLETRYGQVLVFKLVLVAALLGFAAINRWRLLPAMQAGAPAAGARFAASVRLELLLGILLLLATAVLAHTPPHENAGHRQAPAAAGGPGVPTVLQARAGNGAALKLSVVPARVGTNTVSMALLDAEGKPLSPVEVLARFSLPALGVEAIERPLVAASAGQFHVERVDLPVAGRWRIEVTILFDEFTNETLEFDLPLR